MATDAGWREGLVDLSAVSRFDAALREVPTDPEAIAASVKVAGDRLAAARAAHDAALALKLLGYLGDACRLLGRHDQAVAHQTQAVALASERGDRRAELVAFLRLADAHRYRGDLAVAEALFRDALARCQGQDLADQEDFARQHLGKCRLDQGDPDEALGHFARALAIRRAKGDPDLIRSTELALALAGSRVTANGASGPLAR